VPALCRFSILASRSFSALRFLAGILIAMFLLTSHNVQAQQPTPVIFDTDVGNDIDDALALAMLHAMESRGEVKILAVTITKGNEWAAPYVDLVDTFYGRPNIPIGMVRDGKTPSSSPMLEVPSNERSTDGAYVYPHDILRGSDAQDAVPLLRKTLASQSDRSVVVIQVGFSTNLARLLETNGDTFSPLDGISLVRQKVKTLVLMGGNFSTGKPEFNIQQDVPAARELFAKWPTPVICSGFEIGQRLLFPATAIETRFSYVANHPVADAYRHYMKMPYDRPAWDLTAVLYAVRPNDDYFSLSGRGTVQFGDDGSTKFTPSASGNTRYLVLNPTNSPKILDVLIDLSSQPPDSIAKPH
jgi:inosine-uridine nucleoside N-ribohydrolase